MSNNILFAVPSQPPAGRGASLGRPGGGGWHPAWEPSLGVSWSGLPRTLQTVLDAPEAEPGSRSHSPEPQVLVYCWFQKFLLTYWPVNVNPPGRQVFTESWSHLQAGEPGVSEGSGTWHREPTPGGCWPPPTPFVTPPPAVVRA